MKKSPSTEADSASMRALSWDKIGVEVNGIELAELVSTVNSHGDILIVGHEPGTIIIAVTRSPQ